MKVLSTSMSAKLRRSLRLLVSRRAFAVVSMAVVSSMALTLSFADGSKAAKLKSSAKVMGQSFLDLKGAIHRIGGRSGQSPTVIVFLGTTCPISNRAVPKLKRIAVDAKKLGVEFYGVIADPFTSRKEAIRHSKDFKVTFPVIFDGSLSIARDLKPSHVPQCYILNSRGHILYTGAIDDSWADISKPKARAHKEYLHDAVKAVAAKRAVKITRTAPIGCIFEAGRGKTDGAKVTFNRDVAPIIFKSCTPCHRPGEAAPFALQNYKDVARRAQQIAAVTESRIMPPWKPVKGHGEFLDESRLSLRDIKILARWADAGAPEGSEDDKVTAPKFSRGWQLEKPDLVLKMKEAYTVRAEGQDDFRCFVIPTGLLEDKHVVAMEYRPGNAAVVHHAILFLDDHKRGRKLAARDPKPGYGVFGGIGFPPSGALGGYSPGARPAFLPDGVARILKKGTDIILQVHYHPTGKVETDLGTIGLHFARKPVKKIMQGMLMGSFNLDIAPGAKNYQRHVELTLPVPVNLLGVTPHMHYLGKEMKIVATTPGGKKIPIIWIREWDFRWQGQYLYRKPVRLPAGTRIVVDAAYDNSTENPANPSSPPKRVTYGDGSTNEMCFAFFQLTTDKPEHMQGVRAAVGQMFMKERAAIQRARQARDARRKAAEAKKPANKPAPAIKPKKKRKAF
jgi:hypothetical protein